jgi:tetratricopeptide (TPR) repeat protein
VLHVSEPDEVTGLRILKKLLNDGDSVLDEGDAIKLLTRLTFLPLAITQAAAYITENDIKISKYVELLEEQESLVIELLSEDFEDEGRYETTQNPVATTWWISFQQIQRQNQLAADYLSSMACMDPRDLPHSLLPQPSSKNEGIKAIGLLKAYAFVTEQAMDHSLNLHRLVHLATRNWLRTNHQFVRFLFKAAERLNEVFPNDNFTNRQLWQAYISHALAVVKENEFTSRREKYLGLMEKIGQCLYSDGRYKEAETIFADVVHIQRRKRGPNDATTLSNMSRLAFTYGNQGHWKHAERLEEQVMKAYKKILGPQDPRTLSSLSNLASIYQSQGRWDEAQKIQSQVMRTYTKTLGPQHENTLISMHNLALTYNHLGKLRASEDLLTKVKNAWEVLGPEHPRTLTSINSLAVIHQRQCQWKKAEDLFLKVMQARKRILGPRHPHTLTSMYNLASTYRSQEQWEEAESMLVEVLKISQLVLGPEHPDTLATMNDLAQTLRSRGKEREALHLTNEFVQLSGGTAGDRLVSYTEQEQCAGTPADLETGKGGKLMRESKNAGVNPTATTSSFSSPRNYTIVFLDVLRQEREAVNALLDEW